MGVKPDTLLAGKVAGAGAVGLTQQLLWIAVSAWLITNLAPLILKTTPAMTGDMDTSAVGMSFVLQNVGLLWLGGSPAGVDDLIHAQQQVFKVAGIAVQRADLLAFAVTIPLVLLMVTFITQTRLGKAMRATAQDPDAARLMGINVDTTISATFLIGGMLAGAAGLIYALYQTTIWYFQGFQGGLLAFTAAVMGGIGNLRGAVLGGTQCRRHEQLEMS